MLSDRKILGGLDKKLASVRLSYDRFARIRNVLQNAPGADPFLLNFQCLVEKLGGEHKARFAKKIIRESKAIKLALGIEHDAKKLEHLLAQRQSRAAQPGLHPPFAAAPAVAVLRARQHQERQSAEPH